MNFYPSVLYGYNLIVSRVIVYLLDINLTNSTWSCNLTITIVFNNKAVNNAIPKTNSGHNKSSVYFCQTSLFRYYLLCSTHISVKDTAD